MNIYAPPTSNPAMQQQFQRPPNLQQTSKQQAPVFNSQVRMSSQQQPTRPMVNGYSQPQMNNVTGQMQNMNLRTQNPNQQRFPGVPSNFQQRPPSMNQPGAPSNPMRGMVPPMSSPSQGLPSQGAPRPVGISQNSLPRHPSSGTSPGPSSLTGPPSLGSSRPPGRGGPPSLSGPPGVYGSSSSQPRSSLPNGPPTFTQPNNAQPNSSAAPPPLNMPPSVPSVPGSYPNASSLSGPTMSGPPRPMGNQHRMMSGPPGSTLSSPPSSVPGGLPPCSGQVRGSVYQPGYGTSPGVLPPPGPGMSAPGMTRPGMSGPGMSGPGMSAPGMSGPGMSGPGLAGPGMAGPGMAGPGMAGPGMAGPGMGRQHQPMGGPMGNQQPKRIDPNQMPNPIQVMKDDQTTFESGLFQTSTRGKVPPLVSTKCRIQDDGNCSPRYIRSTVYSVPCNQDMLKESGIPMAIVATPFAKIPEDEYQLRYVDQGPSGPVRCNRCKAYMNPFMQFIDGGRRFVCNICSHSSEVPPEYFCHLDHQGRRVDMHERPELYFGSYEYIATTDYCKDSKLPSPPAFIFMIDVSYQSMQQGMVKSLVKELSTLLENLPKDVGMEESLIRVGFVTYNTQLHFYNIKENLAQPQMMVMSDINDAFVPLMDGFLVSYKESKAVIESLLDMLPQIFKDTKETDVILGPVITSGIEALKAAGISGKLYIFHSSLPIAEAPGKLKNREDRKLLYTDKEKTILTPQGNYYMNLAKECVANGVSIDLFLFTNSYIDVATIGLMVSQTGGQTYRYSYFKEATHGKQFVTDLRKNFARELGFDAIMRLRCSSGLRPVEFFGSFTMNNTTDVELASIDSDKAIAIEMKHDDKIPEDGVAFIQCALLYTSVAGQRRLRIHNLAFSTCSQLADLYRCCELDTTVNYFSKYALRQVLSSNPQAIKENLIQKCVQILACYRQHCATPSTAGQLILPECLKLLPLFINSLIKSDVLAGGSEISSDDRSYLMQACLSMSPSISAAYFYPRVIALHNLDTDHEDDLIPEPMRCLGEKFEDSGVYLLENAISMFLWVGLQTPTELLQQIFGINGIGQLDIEMTHLPELETPLSKRIQQIIEAIQEGRQRYLKITIVRQRDKIEPWFKHYIVEDKGFHASHLSYVDFLCHVHREIRNLLN